MTELARLPESPFGSRAGADDVFDALDLAACIITRLPLRPDGRRDYRYAAVNPAMQGLFGIPDLTGASMRDSFPDEVEDWYDDYDHVLATGEAVRRVRETEPQGMVLDMAVTRMSGNRLLVVLQDVSRQHEIEASHARAEDQLRLLNRELGQRLKNLFAMVRVITTQSLRGISERNRVKALEGRIRALSSAHDLLLQQHWKAADLCDLVDGAAGALGVAERLDRDGPRVVVDAQAALSIAMLLHELGTNAFKHGALSVPQGRVRLSWRIEGTGAEAMFRLRWVETGGPTVSAPAEAGFGSRLISMGIGGARDVDIRYEPGGLALDMAAPLAALVPQSPEAAPAG